MAAITINIPEQQLQQLQAMAQTNGISTEEVLRTTIEDWLNYLKGDFEQAAKYVLKKNSEFYRRLA
ncbi:ribbon-helix-helix protein, CopG family [Trichormus azollae]|uniref:ribbon-helix-helix protein, CopG family n=1 Tax=Trichormus azollae TaxID=1164 RepID=UPI00325EB1F8